MVIGMAQAKTILGISILVTTNGRRNRKQDLPIL
jgi:hypothetical protein